MQDIDDVIIRRKLCLHGCPDQHHAGKACRRSEQRGIPHPAQSERKQDRDGENQRTFVREGEREQREENQRGTTDAPGRAMA